MFVERPPKTPMCSIPPVRAHATFFFPFCQIVRTNHLQQNNTNLDRGSRSTIVLSLYINFHRDQKLVTGRRSELPDSNTKPQKRSKSYLDFLGPGTIDPSSRTWPVERIATNVTMRFSAEISRGDIEGIPRLNITDKICDVEAGNTINISKSV